MIVMTQLCRRCGSEQVRKNGSSGGRTKYQCKACAFQGYVHPAGPGRAVRYARVDQLGRAQFAAQHRAGHGRFAHDHGQAGKKKCSCQVRPCPACGRKKAQRRVWEALELDEMWTYVGQRRRKVWLWLAVERASRRIVAWVLGRRDAATARRLWQALPGRYRRHWLVLHRPVPGLRGRAAALAAPPPPQGRRRHERHRSR